MYQHNWHLSSILTLDVHHFDGFRIFRMINWCCRYQPWNTQQKQQVFNVPGIKIDVRNVVVIMHSSFIFNVPPAMQLSCCLTSLRSQRREILSKQSFWDFIFFLGCKRSSRFHSSKCLNIFNAKWNRVQGQGSPLALQDFQRCLHQKPKAFTVKNLNTHELNVIYPILFVVVGFV